LTNDAHRKEEHLDYATLKKILDNSHDEIYVTDASGTVIYVNEASKKHFGVDPADIIGKSSKELSRKQYWSPRLSPLVFKNNTSLTVEQKTCLGKTLLTTATPVYDDKGNIEMIIENSRDVSDTQGLTHELEISKHLLSRYKLEVNQLRKKELSSADFVCKSTKMLQLMEMTQRIAATDSTVLLTGESGTGKSVLVVNLHKNSPRKKGPFIVINCAAIPAELMESEFFGYSGGTFTGAHEKGKIGMIELANEGTLFLDEIAEIPVRLQAKLLHALQEKKYFTVGGRETKNVNCRIVAATNRDLKEMMRKGEFREDLYYRLNIFELEVPPLRERPEDILPLINYFLEKFNDKYQMTHKISPRCLNIMLNYSWPGNVRELENAVERLVVMVPDEIIEEIYLPKSIQQDQQTSFVMPSEGGLEEALDQIERNLILEAYKNHGSSYAVAKALKTSQSKASRLIRKHLGKDADSEE
jgi:PAS domain S-box-containing protein